MEEPEEIFFRVEQYFTSTKDALSGKKILVTAGPTHEPIDPVRFIGNHSTGKMGFAIAAELAARGAQVTLVAGPVSLSTPAGVASRIDVTTADEMFSAATGAFPDMDAGILTAAVSDFKPAATASQKLKKTDAAPEIRLMLNPDILATLGKMKKNGQILAGFALETDNEIGNAKMKLKGKNLDFIVLNSLNDQGAGFGGDNNKVTFLDNKNQISGFELKSKQQVAVDVVNKLSAMLPKEN